MVLYTIGNKWKNWREGAGSSPGLPPPVGGGSELNEGGAPPPPVPHPFASGYADRARGWGFTPPSRRRLAGQRRLAADVNLPDQLLAAHRDFSRHRRVVERAVDRLP